MKCSVSVCKYKSDYKLRKSCFRNKNRSPATTTRYTIVNPTSGLRNIIRTVDSDVFIPRRFGEGSTPIFQREDVHVNVGPTKSDTPKELRSSSNSTSEHIRYKTQASRRDREAPEKLPYFFDSKREEDRLRAKYGQGSTPIFSREDVHVNVVPTKNDTPKKQRSSSNSSSEHIRHKTQASRRDRKTPEKIPYFIDAKREQNRLRVLTQSRSSTRRRTRSRSRSASKSRRRHRSRSRSMRRRRERHRYRSSSRDKSRTRSPYQEQRFIPVAIPMEYPCPASWIAPPMPPYPRHTFMMRPTLPPPIPFYPLRPPFVPMDYPRRPIRFPGRHMRPYRPGPPK